MLTFGALLLGTPNEPAHLTGVGRLRQLHRFLSAAVEAQCVQVLLCHQVPTCTKAAGSERQPLQSVGFGTVGDRKPSNEGSSNSSNESVLVSHLDMRQLM